MTASGRTGRELPAVRRELARRAAREYLASGRVAAGFVAGKLRSDPVFVETLRRGWIRPGGSLVDLGCGRGILFAALDAAAGMRAEGNWPPAWPAPPRPGVRIGIDRSSNALDAARAAWPDASPRFEHGDLERVPVPSAETYVLFDVLHYLDREGQDRLLDRITDAARSGTRLLVREADASGGPGFLAVRFSERLRSIARGHPFLPLRYRSAADWSDALRTRGWNVEVEPLGSGTPFANAAIIATRR